MRQVHLRSVLVAVTVLLPIHAQEKQREAAHTQLQEAAQAAANEGRWQDAAAGFRKLTEVAPKNGRAWHMLGYSLHAAGKLDAALEAHLKAVEFSEFAPIATYNVACVHALKGETDAAFAWLDKAVERGFNNPDQLAIDTDMDSLREDARFKQLVQSLRKAGYAKSKAAPLQTFAVAKQRQSSRVLFWRGQGSPGQVLVQYGTPRWNPAMAGQIESGKAKGKRWRMGQDFWTTLDTNIDLEVAGTRIAAGYYYLAMQQSGEGDFQLVVLDPAEVRKAKLDAYQVAQTAGGTLATLELTQDAEVAETLRITLDAEGQEGQLTVAFGPFRATAGLRMHVEG